MMKGCLEGMDETVLETPADWIKYGDFSEESGYRAMMELLHLHERPAAIFAGNDVIAYGAIKAIKDSLLKIPDDISIVGFDDDFLSRYLNPPLTTVSLPAAGLGSESAKLLIRLILGKKQVNPKQVILPSHLLIRKTCREIK